MRVACQADHRVPRADYGPHCVQLAGDRCRHSQREGAAAGETAVPGLVQILDGDPRDGGRLRGWLWRCGLTPEAQAVFYQRLIETGQHFVYAFAFDAYFAATGPPPGGFGGLWDADLNPKPAVAVIDLGRY
jgi:hypothetical protein